MCVRATGTDISSIQHELGRARVSTLSTSASTGPAAIITFEGINQFFRLYLHHTRDGVGGGPVAGSTAHATVNVPLVAATTALCSHRFHLLLLFLTSFLFIHVTGALLLDVLGCI